MQKKTKSAFKLATTSVLIALICSTAAQAAQSGAQPRNSTESAGYNLKLSVDTNASGSQQQGRNWLALTPVATTLRLTANGLARLDDSAIMVAPLFPKALVFPARSVVLTAVAAPQTRSAGQDKITTASIPAAARPAGSALSRTIRPDVSLFGAHRIRFGKISSGSRISGLIRKAEVSGASAICINQCAALADRLSLSGADLTEQLRRVSASVNALVSYRTDEQNHGRLDQWSTPNETLRRGSGDCEDYAILKMAILARLGIPITAMEIVVVKDTSRRLYHAVLAVALEDRSLILDNMTNAVETDKAKRDYAPLFSLSGKANYVFGYKGGKSDLMASLKNMAAIAPGAGF